MLCAIRKLMTHPLTRGMDIDDPHTTELRREIIRSKPFLRRLYADWYSTIAANVPDSTGSAVEIGSGGGFLDEYVPDIITSEMVASRYVSIALDGCTLPFRDHALRAIVLIDVMHHMNDVRRFFREAERCLIPGGRILMIEPWVSSWSRLIFSHLHHEPFRPDDSEWTFPAAGPLSGANGALPWIVFQRDRHQFETEFPALRVRRLEPYMPFRYIVSGGVSMRGFAPAVTYPMWRILETVLKPWPSMWAMFAFIALEYRPIAGSELIAPFH